MYFNLSFWFHPSKKQNQKTQTVGIRVLRKSSQSTMFHYFTGNISHCAHSWSLLPLVTLSFDLLMASFLFPSFLSGSFLSLSFIICSDCFSVQSPVSLRNHPAVLCYDYQTFTAGCHGSRRLQACILLPSGVCLAVCSHLCQRNLFVFLLLLCCHCAFCLASAHKVIHLLPLTHNLPSFFFTSLYIVQLLLAVLY